MAGRWTDRLSQRATRYDLLLIGALLSIGIVSLLFVNFRKGEATDRVVITIDGSFYGDYALSEEALVPIRVAGKVANTLQIRDGEAKMIEADCPDQLCIHQKAISRQGETIICLPNKIIVEASGIEGAAYDSLSR